MDIAIADYKLIERDGNTVFYFPPDKEGAKRLLSAMEQSFGLYSAWFGSLKQYHGLSIIEVPQDYGGQSDVASIL